MMVDVFDVCFPVHISWYMVVLDCFETFPWFVA